MNHNKIADAVASGKHVFLSKDEWEHLLTMEGKDFTFHRRSRFEELRTRSKNEFKKFVKSLLEDGYKYSHTRG